MTAIALRIGTFEAPLLAADIELSATGAVARLECDHETVAGRGLVGVGRPIELHAGERSLFAGQVGEVTRDFEARTVEIRATGAAAQRAESESESPGPRVLDAVHRLKVKTGGAPRLRVELEAHPMGVTVRGAGGSGHARASPRPPQRAAWPAGSGPDWPTYRFRANVSEASCNASQAAALAKELHTQLAGAWLSASGETDAHDLLPGDRVRVAELADTVLVVLTVRHALAAGSVVTSFVAEHLPAPPALEHCTCVAPSGAERAPATAPEAPRPAPPPISAPLATRWALDRLAGMAQRGLNSDGSPRGAAPEVAEIAQSQNDTEAAALEGASIIPTEPAHAGEAN